MGIYKVEQKGSKGMSFGSQVKKNSVWKYNQKLSRCHDTLSVCQYVFCDKGTAVK